MPKNKASTELIVIPISAVHIPAWVKFMVAALALIPDCTSRDSTVSVVPTEYKIKNTIAEIIIPKMDFTAVPGRVTKSITKKTRIRITAAIIAM